MLAATLAQGAEDIGGQAEPLRADAIIGQGVMQQALGLVGEHHGDGVQQAQINHAGHVELIDALAGVLADADLVKAERGLGHVDLPVH